MANRIPNQLHASMYIKGVVTMKLQEYGELHPIVRLLIQTSEEIDRNKARPLRQSKPNTTLRKFGAVLVKRTDLKYGVVRRIVCEHLNDLWVWLPGGKVEARIDPRTSKGRTQLNHYEVIGSRLA